MKLKLGKEFIPHLGVIALIALGLLLTRNWPYETALFPRVGCMVVLIIAVISLLSELLRGKKQESDAWVASHLSGEHSLKRVGVVFGWLALFLIGIWALGYEFAAVAFVFLFMKVPGRQSWRISILFTVFSFVFLYSVFRLLLDVIWPHGALWEMLGL